jgi:hypothetical protein
MPSTFLMDETVDCCLVVSLVVGGRETRITCTFLSWKRPEISTTL